MVSLLCDVGYAGNKAGQYGPCWSWQPLTKPFSIGLEEGKCICEALDQFLPRQTEHERNLVVVCRAFDNIPKHAFAEINQFYFRSEVIGDFPEEEARNVTDCALFREGKKVELSENDGSKVWQVWVVDAFKHA